MILSPSFYPKFEYRIGDEHHQKEYNNEINPVKYTRDEEYIFHIFKYSNLNLVKAKTNGFNVT